MRKHLEKLEARFLDVEAQLGSELTFQDQNKIRDLSRELSALRPTIDAFRELKRVETAWTDLDVLSRNPSEAADMKKLYQEEKDSLEKKRAALEQELDDLIFESRDTDKDRNVIMEIRAGTGGDEAALFAGDLFRLYSRFSAKHGLKVEVLNTNSTGLGGVKEIIFSVTGPRAFRWMRFESGTHRVQRVPQTEAGGRIHTSAVTVAVLPEPEEIELDINPQDLRVDVYRSSGPGGQGVNTTDSAVRITHLPTNLVVTCQDERSQLKNKVKAMRILKARLLDQMHSRQEQEMSAARRSQVGSGDRSEKIRTYNFPDRRATDHRAGITLYSLAEVMEGEIEPFIEHLYREERKRFLEEGAGPGSSA